MVYKINPEIKKKKVIPEIFLAIFPALKQNKCDHLCLITETILTTTKEQNNQDFHQPYQVPKYRRFISLLGLFIEKRTCI